MKMIKNILILASLSIAFAACVKEPAADANASFEIYMNNELITADSVPIVTDGYFQLTGVADRGKCVYFNGKPGYRYGRPGEVGQPADSRGRLAVKYYIAGVTDSVWCIATTVGNWGDEIKQDKKLKVFKTYKIK